MGKSSDFDVVSGDYDFESPIVGFKAKFDSTDEYAIRYLNFYVNYI